MWLITHYFHSLGRFLLLNRRLHCRTLVSLSLSVSCPYTSLSSTYVDLRHHELITLDLNRGLSSDFGLFRFSLDRLMPFPLCYFTLSSVLIILCVLSQGLFPSLVILSTLLTSYNFLFLFSLFDVVFFAAHHLHVRHFSQEKRGEQSVICIQSWWSR